MEGLQSRLERGRRTAFRPPWRLQAIDWRAFVLPVGLIVIAEVSMAGTHLDASTARTPSEIVGAWYDAMLDGTLLTATLQTLWAAMNGLVIGGAIGLAMGVGFGLSTTADRLSHLSVEAIRPIPSAALIPVMLLFFGFGYRMEIGLIIPACAFPIMIFTRSAVAGTDPRLLEVARALGFGIFARVWKIILPAALPRIFVGFRLSAALALVISVTVEVAANPQGLGNMLMIAEQTLQPELMWATLIWIGVAGYLLNAFLMWGQNRLFGPAGTIGMKP